MEKTAQKKSGKRSLLNKLREMSNVSGIAAEKFFNPEFERVMNSLRETDNKIRSIVSGQEIEGEDPGNDSVSLKNLYKSAKSNINRREYMTAIAFLGRFHKKMYEVTQIINKLNLDVDQIHHDFLFKDLDDEQKQHLSDLKSRLASVNYQLVAQAGIMDFLVNVSTDRGKALSAWEKRYPKQVGKLKKEAAGLLQKTEVMLNAVISVLKEMATYRATRKVDDYVKATNKLTAHYNNYDRTFKDFYNANVKGFLEKQELIAPTKKVDEKDLSKQEVNTSAPPTVTSPLPDVPDLDTPAPKSTNINLPSVHLSQAPEFDNLEDLENSMLNAPKIPTNLGPTTPPPAFTPSQYDTIPQVTTPSEAPDEEKVELPKSAHSNFYNSLEALAGESPLILSNYIKKYALSIQGSDLDTALQLLKIAKNIRE